MLLQFYFIYNDKLCNHAHFPSFFTLSQFKTFAEVCSNNRVEDVITSAVQRDANWNQTLLLSEDIAVWKMPSLRDAHEQMTFDPHQEIDLSQQDEVKLNGFVIHRNIRREFRLLTPSCQWLRDFV